MNQSTWFVRLASCVAIVLASLVAGETSATAATPTSGISAAAFDPSDCKGWGGVASNAGGFVLGTLQKPILLPPDMEEPRLDGDVVRMRGKVAFKSIGSCSAQVAFQAQTKVCGAFGCNWTTRNHGTWEFLWEHATDGYVSAEVSMKCRSGTHSYRIHLDVVGAVSVQEEPKQGGKGAAQGAAPITDLDQDGPVVKLTC